MGLVFRNATVIDCLAPGPREHTDLRVEGERIQALGQSLPAGPDDRVIDCAGRCLVPGLIDCHVHLCFDAGPKPVETMAAEPDATLLLKMAAHARQTLQRGVTTVRDLGAPRYLDVALRDAIARGWVPGPRMQVSGPVLTITGGHGHFFGYEVDTLDELRRAVRQNVKAGVDVIKVMATGGRLTPTSSMDRAQFTLEELSTIVQEASLARRRVAAHTGGLEGIRRAVAAGVTSIEHASYIDDATLHAAKERGVVWVPTNAPAVCILENKPGYPFPSAYPAAVAETWAARRAATRRGMELGVRFAAGTDAGVPCTPHGGVAREVQLFHELGMPPLEALLTATRHAADLLGWADRVGTLEPGKYADLLVLRDNPLADLAALDRIDLVVQGGEIIDR